MRVALLISSLRPGGAERVASIAVNYWARMGWQVFLFTLAGNEEPPFYDLDPAVTHVPLGISWTSTNPLHGLANNFQRVWLIRRELAKVRPDVLVSFMDTTNVLAVLATRGLGVPVVASERTNPAARDLKTVWRLLRDYVYGMAEAVVVQTERAKACFSVSVQARCVVIPNPVLPASPSTGCAEVTVPRPALVAVGRLSEEKGLDLLVAAFARLAARHPSWHLVIVGEGPQRGKLETQIVALGVRDRVLLPGRVRNPQQLLKQCDAFVLPSRHEGFPNVLCEAMACGLPVISFDCPFGPAEIIRDGVDGILVPAGDSDALVETLDRLMACDEERQRLARRAPEVVERFGLSKVMGLWDQLLTNMV